MIGVSDSDAVFIIMISSISFTMGVFACRDIDIVIDHFRNSGKKQWWN
jgi:hypothetical protein